MTLEDATGIVMQFVQSAAWHLSWRHGGIVDKLRQQEAAKSALATIPTPDLVSFPFYASVDEGQCGVVVSGHLTAGQMLGVPMLIVNEMLDELATCAGGANHA